MFCLKDSFEDVKVPKSSPIMLMGSFRAAAVTTDAHTVAAPPISALIASIEGDGFREIPPLPNEETHVMKRSL